jgi:hypothetical protein
MMVRVSLSFIPLALGPALPRPGLGGDDQSHGRDQDPSWQAEDSAGMQGKLRLRKDVGDGALPRHEVTERASVETVVVEPGRTDAGGAVIVAGMMEHDAIDAITGRVEDAADRLVPTAPPSVVARRRDDLGEAEPSRSVRACRWQSADRMARASPATPWT